MAMFGAWFGDGVAAVGEAWSGVKEAAGSLGLKEKLDEVAGGLHLKETLEGVTTSLQQLLDDDDDEEEEEEEGEEGKAGQAPKRANVLPPWEDLGGPEAASLPDKTRQLIRSQILSLAKNRRNFAEPPPAGTAFEFVFEEYEAVAAAAVAADPHLRKIRLCLVPQFVKETEFWHNYFYRVKAIKEMHGLRTQTVVPSPSSSSSSSSPASQSVKQAGRADGEERAGQPTGSAGDYPEDSDEEDAAFMAELEQLALGNEDHSSVLGVATQAASPSAEHASPIGDAKQQNDEGGITPAVPAAANASAGLADQQEERKGGGDGNGDEEDDKWEEELELELKAELESLDAQD